jgi:DNA-binding NarL/FixJ family response regulator
LDKMRILIAEPVFLIRRGLRDLLRELDGDVEVLESDSVRDAVTSSSECGDLNVIMFEPKNCGMNWMHVARKFRVNQPNASVVMFSTVENRGDILRAIELGVTGFIPKTSGRDEILSGLRIILEGGIYLPRPPQSQSGVSMLDGETLPNGSDAVSADSIQRLTKRQQEVLGHLTLGRSNADIAKELGTSEHTVRIHVSAILKSLSVSNRTKAALAAAPYYKGARPKQDEPAGL